MRALSIFFVCLALILGVNSQPALANCERNCIARGGLDCKKKCSTEDSVDHSNCITRKLGKGAASQGEAASACQKEYEAEQARKAAEKKKKCAAAEAAGFTPRADCYE